MFEQARCARISYQVGHLLIKPLTRSHYTTKNLDLSLWKETFVGHQFSQNGFCSDCNCVDAVVGLHIVSQLVGFFIHFSLDEWGQGQRRERERQFMNGGSERGSRSGEPIIETRTNQHSSWLLGLGKARFLQPSGGSIRFPPLSDWKANNTYPY